MENVTNYNIGATKNLIKHLGVVTEGPSGQWIISKGVTIDGVDNTQVFMTLDAAVDYLAPFFNNYLTGAKTQAA